MRQCVMDNERSLPEMRKAVQSYREELYSGDKSLLNRRKRFDSLEELEENLETSQFNIDLDGWHFECLFHQGVGDSLYVIYDGAHTAGAKLPLFPRWSYHNMFPGSMLCIEDAMFYKFPELRLAWHYGTEKVSLVQISLHIVRAVQKHLGIEDKNTIFYGSSGGGLQAYMQRASCMGVWQLH